MKRKDRKWFSGLILLTLLSIMGQNHEALAQGEGKIIIKGRFEGEYSTDEVQILLFNDLLLPTTKHIQQTLSIKGTVDPAGRFSFEIPHVDSAMYLYLGQGTFNGKPIPILDLFPINVGDSIYMLIHSTPDTRFDKHFSDSRHPRYLYDIQFSGRGWEKFKVKHELGMGKRETINEMLREEKHGKGDGFSFGKVEFSQRVFEQQVKLLDRYRHRIGEEVYHYLKLELLSSALMDMGRRLRHEKNDVEGLLVFKNSLNLLEEIPPHFFEKSPFFNQMILALSEKEDILQGDTRLNFVPSPTTVVMDRFYAAFLLENWKEFTTDNITIYFSILDKIHLPYYRGMMKELFADRPTDILSDLTLTDVQGKEITLTRFKGKVIFLDFYYTGCGNCISYFKGSVSRAEQHFSDNEDVLFIAVSIDGNREKWLKTLQGEMYSSKSAVNLYTGGLGASHPIIKKLNIRGYPSPLLISKEGKIVSSSYIELGQNDPMELINRIQQEL